MKLFNDNSIGAEFSPCRKYRYSLWRIWNKNKPLVVFICLNPSTADENKNDPTIRRCINYAEAWGYGGMVMLNIFAYRSKDRSKIYDVDDPVGPENDKYIKSWCQKADKIIVAWGNDGIFEGRSSDVLRWLNRPYCLARTLMGEPSHPLYMKKNLKPIRFWKHLSYEDN